MQHLGNLSPARGSHRSRKRIGRGPGSGTGRTAGKGSGGQRARKSGGLRPGFEGGQTPLYRRVPKRGFNAPARIPQVILQLRDLRRFEEGSVVTPQVLKEAGLWRAHRAHIKILGGDSLDRALTVSVHGLSKSAREAIEKAGGTVQLLPKASSSKEPTSSAQNAAHTPSPQIPADSGDYPKSGGSPKEEQKTSGIDATSPAAPSPDSSS